MKSLDPVASKATFSAVASTKDRTKRRANTGNTLQFVTLFRPYLMVKNWTVAVSIYNYYNILYGKVYEKRDLACIIKKYNKNALHLICYNFRTVNAINFLFTTLHTAPFLYGKIYIGVLHLLRVSIATFDTPLGSNPP